MVVGKKLLVKAILALLALGVLSYGYLPEAYCDLEDKTVKYIHLSDSRKTATKVIPGDGEGWKILDDRCQKGLEIGQWQPLKEIPKQKCPIVIGYVTNCETGKTDKYFCNGIGEGQECRKEDELLMPFG